MTPTRSPTRPTSAPSLKLQSNHNGKNQATSSPSSTSDNASTAAVTPMDMISATPGVFIMIIVMSIIAACLLAVRLYFCFRSQSDDTNNKHIESLAIQVLDEEGGGGRSSSNGNNANMMNGKKSPRKNQSPRQTAAAAVEEGKPRILKFTNNLNDDFSVKVTPRGNIVPLCTDNHNVPGTGTNGNGINNNINQGTSVDSIVLDDVSSQVSYENLYSTYASSPLSRL